MFERIVIRQRSSQSIGPAVDLGFLAEALLFYSDVVLVADYGVLRALLASVTPNVVVELVEAGYLRLAYEADRLAMLTLDGGTAAERHEAISYSADRHQLQNAVPEILRELTGRPGNSRRVASRLIPHVAELQHPDEVTAAARAAVTNAPYVAKAVRVLLERLVPEYHGGSHFAVVPREGQRVVVETNIDFEAANAVYHTRVPETHSSLSPAFLLAHLATIKTDLLVASLFSGELAIDDINAELMRLDLDDVLAAGRPGRERLEMFQDFVFGESRAVGEAVRTGCCTMADVLHILPNAARFKEWLRRENVGPDLLKAYFREATQNTWVDRLPGKTARWSIFTGIGLGLDVLGAGGAGTVAATALSAVTRLYSIEYSEVGSRLNSSINSAHLSKATDVIDAGRISYLL